MSDEDENVVRGMQCEPPEVVVSLGLPGIVLFKMLPGKTPSGRDVHGKGNTSECFDGGVVVMEEWISVILCIDDVLKHLVGNGREGVEDDVVLRKVDGV